ncbi:hypothetical protein BN903_4 [Halorubrum sp. AJ67]|nr:hypothetical protein BN903_4 [Halorubrum sp. AJ67]
MRLVEPRDHVEEVALETCEVVHTTVSTYLSKINKYTVISVSVRPDAPPYHPATDTPVLSTP